MNASPIHCVAPRRHPYRRRLVLTSSLLIALQSLAATPAWGQSSVIQYETGIALLHSDNIALTDSATMDETIISPFLRMEADHEGSRLRLKARGQAEYLHYTGNTYENELRGEMAAQLNWSVAPERMELVVSDWLVRAPVDVFTSLVPTNQQEVNIFEAGPSFFARFDAATQGRLDLRYGNTRAAETKDFNGDRLQAAARLARVFNPTTSGSLNLVGTRAQFDRGSGSTDFKRVGVYLGLARSLAAIDVQADLGMARVSQRGLGDTSAPTARVRLDWRITPYSVLSAASHYELGDAALHTSMDTGETVRPILDSLTDAALAAGPALFRHRRFEVYYRYRGDRLNLQIHPRHQVFRYLEDKTQNQTLSGGIVELGYMLRQNVTVAASAEYMHRRFETIARRDYDTRFLLSMINDLGRNWTWRVDFEHKRRNGSIGSLGYDVNAVVLSIIYRR